MLTKNEQIFALRVGYKFTKKPFPCWNDNQGFRVSEQEIKDNFAEIHKIVNIPVEETPNVP